MIEGNCACGNPFAIGEATANAPFACRCGRAIHPISAEPLADGTGAGDFDAQLLIQAGPSRLGETILLGGCVDIEIGKLDDKHIHLPDEQVSRFHAKLVRLDFGPSRWRIDDNHSTNGLFVNGAKVTSHELRVGDLITIGNYDLRFSLGTESALPPLATMTNAQTPFPAFAGLATSVASITAVASSDPAPAFVQPLTYEQQSGDGVMPGRPLIECDQRWVVRLRIASVLLLFGLVITFFIFAANFMHGFSTALARGVPAASSGPAKVPLVAGMLAGLVGAVAAWLLTTPEPMGAGEHRHTISGILLRIFATVAAVGDIMAPIGLLIDAPSIQIAGTLIALAGVARVFLLLYYIRYLALRIPNEWLAGNCIIVMIGLPATLGLIAGAVLHAMLGGGAAGIVLTSASLGACGFCIFGLWYIILLIWFQSALDF